MLKELATVAAYGASASFGRDVYRSTKQGNPIIWLGLAAFMSIAGFKILSAGGEHEDSSIGFFPAAGAIILIIAGVAIFDGILLFVMIYTGFAAYYAAGETIRIINIMVAVSTGYFVLSALIGSSWGSNEKYAKQRLWATERHNISFLDDNGFRDLGLGDEIVEDRDGNRLKVKEKRDDRILFSVIGRRNVRAAITLDEEGRMMDYTGAVVL